MNGLPSDIDVGFLLGLQLAQVCFNVNQLFLKFDRDIEVSIESSCAIRSPAGDQVQLEHFREEATRICSLVGKRLSRAQRAADGGLTLEFEDAYVLQIFNSNRRYESFQLRRGRNLYVA
jgi:hypothetical protein